MILNFSSFFLSFLEDAFSSPPHGASPVPESSLTADLLSGECLFSQAYGFDFIVFPSRVKNKTYCQFTSLS